MLQIKTNFQKEIPCLILEGRLDTLTAQGFDKEIIPLLEKENFIAIDFSECNYLSSIGIRSLLKIEKQMRKTKGGLALCSLSGEIKQVLEIAGLLQVFSVHEDLQKAVLSLISRKQEAGNEGQLDIDGMLYQFKKLNDKSTLSFFDYGQSPEIVGYNELEFSVGIGSPAIGAVVNGNETGLFISAGNFAGFVPENDQIPPDFRLSASPSEAGIFVNHALSFGTALRAFLLTEDKQIHFADFLSHLLQISGSVNLIAGVVLLDQNPLKPTISLLWAAKKENKQKLPQQLFDNCCETEKLMYAGCEILLEKVQSNSISDDVAEFTSGNLSFENIEDITGLSDEKELTKPIAWLFTSEELEDGLGKQLKIEKEGDFEFSADKEFLARRVYVDSARIILSPIHGGYSAQTFGVTSFDHAGRRLRPTILKIAVKNLIERESYNCTNNANPYILNNSSMVLGTEFFGEIGALRYNFVGIDGENTQLKWLAKYYEEWPLEELYPLFDKIFTRILNPWYGQPVRESIYQYKNQNPTKTFFPTLCETAEKTFGISADARTIYIEELGREIANPYWFLEHEYPKREESGLEYYTSICHGDLNMQNILLDQNQNVYLIDFSETKPRCIVSDFARLEAIFMIERSPLSDKNELQQMSSFAEAFYQAKKMDEKLPDNYSVNADKMGKVVGLTMKMREYANTFTMEEKSLVPYYIALLEWVLPVVCYFGQPIERMRFSMIVAALLCENILSQEK